MLGWKCNTLARSKVLVLENYVLGVANGNYILSQVLNFIHLYYAVHLLPEYLKINASQCIPALYTTYMFVICLRLMKYPVLLSPYLRLPLS
jgi:hypothetical protein